MKNNHKYILSMKRIILFLAIPVLTISLTGCKPSFPSHSWLTASFSKQELLEERLKKMSETAELGTVEYTVKKIVKASDKQWYTVGSRQILFQTTAYLKAGIKLDGFTPNNVQVDAENNVTVTLPHAELLSFNMPADEINTVFENVGFFRSHFNAEEQNKILQLGEADLRADIPNLGILQDAEKNAADIFTAMLQQMDYTSVNVTFE